MSHTQKRQLTVQGASHRSPCKRLQDYNVPPSVSLKRNQWFPLQPMVPGASYKQPEIELLLGHLLVFVVVVY